MLSLGLGITSPQFRPFSPSQLFRPGDHGVVLDPSSIGTMFQDAHGQLPVTAPGQPVGLVLDKSQGAGYSGGVFTGLGDERITNGGFDTDSDWVKTGSTSISSGAAHLDGTLGHGLLFQSGVLTAGRTFLAALTVQSLTGELEIIDNDGMLLASVTSPGSQNFLIITNSTSSNFLLRVRSGPNVAEIDNISVREIPGHHAVQDVNDDFRPALGRHPKSGVRNLLTNSHDLSTTDWLKGAGTTVSQGPVSDEFTVEFAEGSGQGSLLRNILFDVGSPDGLIWTWSVEMRAGTTAKAQVGILGDAAGLGYTKTEVVLSNEWQRVSATMDLTGLTGGDYPRLRIMPQGEAGTIHIRRPQIEQGPTATAYQRVTSPYDITEAGQQVVWYIGSDQIDDVLTVMLPDLGTDATEFYADDTGVTISDGLTIGAGDRNLPTPDRLYAYGTLDRALTETEEDQLTAWLNSKRGA